MAPGPTALEGLVLIKPRLFPDERGAFFESWNARRYAELGVDHEFVQDNVSYSRRGVIRGLHFQEPHPQGKLITIVHGTAWDVSVDLRPGSPTFGRWMGFVLSADTGRQLFIPEGFAHGFAALTDEVTLTYKCTEYYHPEAERTLLWNDPQLGIDWRVESPTLSSKDRQGQRFSDLFPGVARPPIG